jgi:thioesterase domain-containing protein
MFLIHDADGEVLLYRNLALRMPRDMAVYGVVPLASGRLPMVHITIEEMAAHYVKEIRACQPEGPYHLGGLCAGGVIAFEVARQLVDLGERVALLALIEAISPQAPIRSQLVTKARLQRTIELLTSFRSLGFLHVAGESSRRLANFIRYEAEDKSLNLLASSLVHLLRRHRKSGFAWPDWLPVPSTRDIYLRAAARYVPKPVANAHAILVRATEGMGGESPSIVLCANPDFGWQSVLGPSLVAIDSPGSHSTLLQEAAVDTVARHLLLALE